MLRPVDRDAAAVDEMLRGSVPPPRSWAAIRSGNSMSGAGVRVRSRLGSMSVGVIDAGLAIAWIRGATRSRKALGGLYTACRDGRLSRVISTVNLVEVLIHTGTYARASRVDPVAFLKASGLRMHPP